MLPEAKRERAISILGRIEAGLELSPSEVGRMFGAAARTVRAWRQGGEDVPELTFARMVAAESAFNRLAQIFRPDRLPQVIRRPAPAFDQQRALDWILEGRIAEVADRYDDGLAFLLKRPA